jgi:glycosyltransferase involved in cell wall biosynthesis
VLVSPGDVAALAEALVRVAEDSDSRRRMGRAARERYETLFSPQAVLPALLNGYRRVAGGSFADAHAPEHDSHPWTHVC